MSKKGHSLIMWTATFATVIVAVTIAGGFIKGALRNKIKGTAGYIFWAKWGQSPDQSSSPTSSTYSAKSRNNQDSREEEVISRSGETKTYAESSSGSSSASANVADGAQALLRTFNLPNP